MGPTREGLAPWLALVVVTSWEGMSETVRDLLERVVALPAAERAALLGALRARFGDATDDEGDLDEDDELSPEWRDEVERRAEEIASGKVATIPADVALAAVRRELAESRSARGAAPPV